MSEKKKILCPHVSCVLYHVYLGREDWWCFGGLESRWTSIIRQLTARSSAELFKTIRNRQERDKRRKSVAALMQTCHFSLALSPSPLISPVTSRWTVGDRGEQLLGVHCGLLIFKLSLLGPKGTPDCVYC